MTANVVIDTVVESPVSTIDCLARQNAPLWKIADQNALPLVLSIVCSSSLLLTSGLELNIP
jgi:hypothetical protein